MELIALLFPAAISIYIRYNRTQKSYTFSAKLLIDYMIWVICNVLLTFCTIIYVLGISEVDSSAFNSFPFYSKYLLIALLIAFITPYIVEIITKYFGIKMEIEKNEEK